MTALPENARGQGPGGFDVVARSGRYRLLRLPSGGFELRWHDRGAERRQGLGRVGEQSARRKLESCAADPSRPPKEVLRSSERLEEAGGLWIERRSGVGAIYLGWYDEAARQTRHVSLRTGDVSKARQALFRCVDRLPEDPRVALERSRPLTVADLLDRYYETHAKSLPSAEQARIAVARLKPIVGARLCDFFEYRDSKKVADDLVASGQSVSYASRTLSVLRSAFNLGRRDRLVRATPLFFEPRTAEHMEEEPLKGSLLELDELARFLDEASEPHVLAAMVALINTAARISSLLELRGSQIDLQQGLLRLNPPGRVQTKKRRPVLRLSSTLRPWVEHLSGDQHLVAYRGRPVDSIKTALRGMRERAGLPDTVNTYSVRHTLGRWMERQRVPDKQISAVLGHIPVATKKTTRRYTVNPETPEYLREATAAIEEFVMEVAARTRRVDLLNPPWLSGPRRCGTRSLRPEEGGIECV